MAIDSAQFGIRQGQVIVWQCKLANPKPEGFFHRLGGKRGGDRNLRKTKVEG